MLNAAARDSFGNKLCIWPSDSGCDSQQRSASEAGESNVQVVPERAFRDAEITKIPFVIARPQAAAIHRPQSAALDCRAVVVVARRSGDAAIAMT